jgi:RES domain-containing protein
MTSKHSARDDWADLKVRALVNMTELHKFDQKLQTCVGILVGKIGDVFDIDWCLVERDWAEDKELRRKLDENYPFRPVAPATKYGFFSQS